MRTLVVSATNLLARGFMLIPTDRLSRDGEPVNGLFAVARGIRAAVAMKAPARAIAVIDPTAPEAWPDLLAAQLPQLAELLHTMGMHVVETPQAGDELHVVASYARAALEAGDDVVVVAVDKRYAQLVSDRVWWYDANKDARYTPEMVQKRFGVGVDKVAEWLGLVGDEDLLPGVKGIGAKGATQLLEEHGTVEQALAVVDTIKGRTGNALRADPDAVRAELVRAKLDDTRPLPLPLAEAAYEPPSAADENALFERLGFVELLAHEGPSTQVIVCDSEAALLEQLAALGTERPIAVHPTLDDDGALAGLAFSRGDGAALYFAFAGKGATVDHGPAAALASWLADTSIPKLAHMREGLLVALAGRGLGIDGMIGDSAAASHLTQPSNWATHELGIIAKPVLGRALPDEDSVRGVGAQRKPWSAIAVDRAASFAGQYADASAAVWHALAPAVAPALLAEYLALSDTCVRMELTGVTVDPDELTRAEHDFGDIEAALEREIYAHAGHELNINSSKQLGAVLFEELKLPIVSHTKTGWSTSIEALERIEHAHPIVALVLRWRLLRRMRDTWIISLRDSIGSDGRVHSRIHPARSFSGRLVHTNPDLGRVPGRTAEMARIRRAFVARPDHALLSIDYSQLGLHVLAHLSKEPNLIEPLRQRADMHRLTASALLDKPADALTDEERQLGKVVNFATFAGQGSSALAQQLGVSAQEAKELIAKFDAHYAAVRAFQDEQLRLAREQGYIVTIAGRRWPIGGLESLDPHDRSYAERLARRGTHEGSVSDVARRGLLDADTQLRAAGLHAQPLAQILDEVLFEVPLAELEQAARIGASAMRNAFILEAPLRVGVEAGPNWADIQPLQVD
ncbi:MAG TPA: DNA polymerase [Kofleriaceae bacterium]|nr:DNA polymerase [Kofleriaceae bacterium]